MKHLREVIPFRGLESFADIQRMRLAANQAKDWFEQLREVAIKQRRAVEAGKTVEKVIFRYARWVGWYRNADGVTASLVRNLQGSPIHGDAIAAVVLCKKAVDEIVGGVHPWMSLPNHEATKFNALRMIDAAVASFDEVLSKLHRLEGHVSQEEQAS